MSRYKKILLGEIETKEINGTKFLLYPTLEHRSEVLDIFKEAQVQVTTEKPDGSKETKQGNFDLKRLIKICSDIVFEGCYNHDEKGNRKALKEDEKDTTYDDIKGAVIDSGVFELYLEIASLVNVIDKDKKKEIDNKISGVGPNPQ
jgi:hypothetical protein